MEEKTLFDDMAESGGKLPDMVKQLIANGWRTKNHHDNWVHNDWSGEYDTHSAFKRIGTKEDSSLITKVFESLGEVSMCWSETPNGVFESTRANEVGKRLMKSIENDLPNAIKVLQKYLSEDKSEGSYYYVWQCNIAMAFKDEFSRKIGGGLDLDNNVHEIANQAAKNFLDLLIK